MSEFEGYGAVIGRASDLVTEESPMVMQALPKEPVHPLVSLEELERPSPQKGHPDPEFPELDTRDPLYIPRFLVRRWGGRKFLRSGYYKFWEAESGRSRRLLVDTKPVRK